MVTLILIWVFLMALVLIFNFRAHLFDDDACKCDNPVVTGDMNNANHHESQMIGAFSTFPNEN